MKQFFESPAMVEARLLVAGLGGGVVAFGALLRGWLKPSRGAR
jgi:hypothetical protein